MPPRLVEITHWCSFQDTKSHFAATEQSKLCLPFVISSLDKAPVRVDSQTNSVSEHADFLEEGLRSLWFLRPRSFQVKHLHVDLSVHPLPCLLQRT